MAKEINSFEKFTFLEIRLSIIYSKMNIKLRGILVVDLS